MQVLLLRCYTYYYIRYELKLINIPGGLNAKNELPGDLNASDIVCMKYAPTNGAADVKRSFSTYLNQIHAYFYYCLVFS